MKTIEIELQNYKQEMRAVDRELAALPAGSLTRKGAFYYQFHHGKEEGITKQPELIRQLCRKKYLLERKKRLAANISVASKFLNRYQDIAPETIIRGLPAAYKGVPDEHFFRQAADDWATQPYKKNTSYPEDLRYLSNNGTLVRSKSEAFIANQLEFYQIPYRYEEDLTFDWLTISPDFTIKRSSDGQIILWEHFGAVHEPGYVEKMYKKFDFYEKHGYIPFETIIYTFEMDIQRIWRVRNYIEAILMI